MRLVPSKLAREMGAPLTATAISTTTLVAVLLSIPSVHDSPRPGQGTSTRKRMLLGFSFLTCKVGVLAGLIRGGDTRIQRADVGGNAHHGVRLAASTQKRGLINAF